MTTDHKQLNVRLPSQTHALAKANADRRGVSVQAYVSGLVENDVNPVRDAFVSGLVGDMTELLGEFEDAFGVGRR